MKNQDWKNTNKIKNVCDINLEPYNNSYSNSDANK